MPRIVLAALLCACLLVALSQALGATGRGTPRDRTSRRRILEIQDDSPSSGAPPQDPKFPGQQSYSAIPNGHTDQDLVTTLVRELELAKTLVYRATEQLARLQAHQKTKSGGVDPAADVELRKELLNHRRTGVPNPVRLVGTMHSVSDREKPPRTRSPRWTSTGSSEEDDDHDQAVATAARPPQDQLESQPQQPRQLMDYPAQNSVLASQLMPGETGAAHPNGRGEREMVEWGQQVEQELESMEGPSARQRLRVLSQEAQRVQRGHAQRWAERRRADAAADRESDAGAGEDLIED